MPFQSLRPSSLIYVLHKDTTPYVEVGTVTETTSPIFTPEGLTVNVSATIGGQPVNFAKLPAQGEIVTTRDEKSITIACSRDVMSAEIRSMKHSSSEVLANLDYHRNVVEQCDKMLQVVNPEYAEQARRDEANQQLRDEVAELKNAVSRLIGALDSRKGAKTNDYANDRDNRGQRE